MEYPTLEQVEAASHEQLARWYRHLPGARNDKEVPISNRITERFNALGGFTPGLSKKIGW